MTDIEFFLKALELKDEKRTGWELRNIEDPESVADHSWGAATLCMLHGDKENVNVNRCVQMALVHDLAETETGDLVTRVKSEAQEINKEDKEKLEQEVMERLVDNIEETEILEVWKEYEERKTPKAQFVKDMDMIDMCLQALKYGKQQRYNPKEDNENFLEYDNLDEFFATTEPRLSTSTAKKLFQEIRQRYEDAKEK